MFVEMDLKCKYLAELLGIVTEEAKYNIYATLREVLHFLMLYYGVTAKKRAKNANDNRLVDPMAYFVKIAEQNLKESESYNNYDQSFSRSSILLGDSRLA